MHAEKGFKPGEGKVLASLGEVKESLCPTDKSEADVSIPKQNKNV